MKKLLKNRLLWMSVVVVVFIGSLFAATLAVKNDEKEKALSRLIMQNLEEYHFSPQKLDDKFSQRVFDLFLKNLDYSKRFLLKSDIEELKHYQLEIDDEVKKGTTDLFDLSSELLNKRITQVQSLTQDILKKPFDFSSDESLETDATKRDYPVNDAELRQLWSLILRYQTETRYLELINNDKTIPKTKKDQFRPDIEVSARESVAKNTVRTLGIMLQENDGDRFDQYLKAIAASFDPHTEYFPPA